MAAPFNILSNSSSVPPAFSPGAHPRPEWLRVKFFGGERYQDLKRIMRTLDLHTVCESARCPNMGECWEHGHRYLHDPGRYLHPGVWILRGPFGEARRTAG